MTHPSIIQPARPALSVLTASPVLVAVLVVCSSLVQAQGREVQAGPMVIGQPTGVIYRTVGPDGRVSFSDQPAAASGSDKPARGSKVDAGASVSQEVIRIPVNRAETEAKAQAQREYWRKQAEAFAARQQQRDQEIELERRARVEAAERERLASQTTIMPGVIVRGGPFRFANQPGFAPVVPPTSALGNGAGAYTSSPGAASAAGPAAFIGSGFSTAQ